MASLWKADVDADRRSVIYPQLLENVKVKDKVAAREDEDVQKAAKEVTESLGDAGRLLLRESGTEPLIPCYGRS